MPIRVTCTCGKGFQAPDSLAGRTVKCPACGAPLSIPTPGGADLLGELADLEAAAQQASLSSASGVGGSLLTASSNAGLRGSSLQLGSSKKSGGSIPLVAIIGGSIIGIVCLVLVGMLILGGKGGERNTTARNSNTSVSPGDGTSSEENSKDDGSDKESADDGSDSSDDASNSKNNKNESDASKDSSTESTRPMSPNRPDRIRPSGGRETNSDRNSGSAIGPHGNRNTGSTSTHRPKPKKDKYISKKFIKGLGKWWGAKKIIASRKDKETEIAYLDFGWMVEILPHIGYKKEYDHFDFDKPWRVSPNFELAHKVIPEFLNPKDDRKESTQFRYEGMGISHFAGMSGVDDIRNEVIATKPRSDPKAGVFGYDEIARRKDITDGTSKTILLIGNGRLAGPWVASGGWTTRGAREPYFDPISGFGSLGYKGKKGAIVLMADGSVKWLKADVDPAVFRAMCTIHGKDSVDLSYLTTRRDAPVNRLFAKPKPVATSNQTRPSYFNAELLFQNNHLQGHIPKKPLQLNLQLLFRKY